MTSTNNIFEFTYAEDLYLLPAATIVVVDKTWSEIPAEHVTLLGKILGSIRQSLASVRVVSAGTIAASDFPAGSRVICFGTAVEPRINLYECVTINGAIFIQSETLGALNDVNKKTLWGALKKL